MLVITMTSYINLLYIHMNQIWNEYLKLESVIHKLETQNHPMVPLLLERLMSLKYEKFQQWKNIKTKFERLNLYPRHYMKRIFLNYETNQLWS